MSEANRFIHPYMPSSDPRQEKPLLDELGIRSASELYQPIPERLRLKGKLNLPPALRSEWELEKHIGAMYAKNVSCREKLNFLGAGCWQHYVPAICDEIASRAEFLTAYCGDTYSDKGNTRLFLNTPAFLGSCWGSRSFAVPLTTGARP